MVTRILSIACAIAVLAAAAVAAPPAKGKKAAAKTIQVNVCPIQMEKVVGKGSGTSVVGKYTVHFCCPSCKPMFDKLSAAEKTKKIGEALKKQG